jgi:hypothetical protein
VFALLKTRNRLPLQRHFLLTSKTLPLAAACGLRPSPFYPLRLPLKPLP